MIDECTIVRDGVPTLDPITGISSFTSVQLYRGICRLRQPTAIETSILFGGEQVSKSRFVVEVPSSVTLIKFEDTITVASDHDGFASTREFRVTHLSSMSYNLYRSIGCEAVETEST